MLAEQKIKRVAQQAAKEVLDTAQAAAAVLAANTANDITNIKQGMQETKVDIKEIKVMLDSKFVTKEEFSTVRSIAYGLVALMMTGVVGSLMYVLFRGPLIR